jgi:predicted enzyme related to lactoylglutathione lyase
MACPVMHFEIGCKDQQKTQEFYSKLFDWKMHTEGPAAMIAAEPSGIGGHITALGQLRVLADTRGRFVLSGRLLRRPL